MVEQVGGGAREGEAESGEGGEGAHEGGEVV